MSDHAEEAWTDEELHVLTRQGVREIDRLAVEEYGVPSIVLMENAALHLARVALEMLETSASPSVVLLCGPGNNGGDGFALARHLANADVPVRVVLAGSRDRYTGDAETNLGIIEKMGIEPVPLDRDDPARTLRAVLDPAPALLVDALLGTGLERPVEGPIRRLIEAVNGAEQRPSVLAADIPSGIDCDSGEVLGVAMKADVTVSFVGVKAGFMSLSAQKHIGDVLVGDIGAPAELTRRLGRPLQAVERESEGSADEEREPPPDRAARSR
jgi:hydroxyethylthiazole kinase-like uncharacterized protein yjeF